MKSKIMIAGAIVAVAALCVLAAGAYSLASRGPAPTCTVNGYVIDTFGKGLPGLDVTLHVLSYDNSTGTSEELYTMVAKTSETPRAGAFSFDRVQIPEGYVIAYTSTSITLNGTTFSGRSNNYTLTANGNITESIVLRTQKAVQVNYDDGPKCALIGHVFDANGNPLGGVNVTLHMIGVLASTGATHEVYTRTLTSYDDLPRAGAFISNINVPPSELEHSNVPVVRYGYADAFIQMNGTTLYGRSDNFTIKDNATVFANLTCVPSPTP